MSQTEPTTRIQQIRTAAKTDRRFFLLFLFLLAYLILYPQAHDGLEYLALRIFGSAVTLLSVYAVGSRRKFVVLALLLAIPTLAQRIFLPRADESLVSLFTTIFSFGFDVFIIIVIFRRVFAEDEPNSEAIFGAVCVYLLVGFSFAGLYGMLATFQPRAFFLDPATNLHNVPNHFDFIYYSFGTITSLGAAGITPVSDQARSLSVIEAILGILYLAVLISRLMGTYRTRPAA